jgi:hypothetical protein
MQLNCQVNLGIQYFPNFNAPMFSSPQFFLIVSNVSENENNSMQSVQNFFLLTYPMTCFAMIGS